MTTSNGGNSKGTITLSVSQLPSHSHGISHTHSYKPSGTVSGHHHGMSHQHTGNTLTTNSYVQYVVFDTSNVEVHKGFSVSDKIGTTKFQGGESWFFL